MLLALGATLPLWFPQLGYYLVVSDPLKKSDAIVVLGGGDMQRIVVAIDLYREKWAPVVITSGNLVPDYIEALGEKLTFAELGARLVIAEGVPHENVIVINEATSTYEEAYAVKKFAQKKNFESIIAVTSIYHTRRSRAVYKKAFNGSGIQVIIRPAEGGHLSTDQWWTREEDLIFVNNEWLKMALYLFQGKI